MIRKVTFFSAAVVGAALSLAAGDAPAKSAKACAAQYASRGKALGSRAAFLQRCTNAGGSATEGGRKRRGRQAEQGRKKPVDPHAPPLDATTGACAEEYESNKAAIDGGGQSRAKFIKDCKNGMEVIPGKTPTATPAAAPESGPAPNAPTDTKPAPAAKAPSDTKPAPAAPPGNKPK